MAQMNRRGYLNDNDSDDDDNDDGGFYSVWLRSEGVCRIYKFSDRLLMYIMWTISTRSAHLHFSGWTRART